MKKEREIRKLQKITSLHGKWYDDACGAAFAAELIGERWSLLIIRELLFGGLRFTDLRGGLPGISAKVLTERLQGMEAAGIVKRRQSPPPASSQLYELTPWGYQAEEPIKALIRWATASSGHNLTLPQSAASLIIGMRALFDPAGADDLATTGGIRIGDEDFVVKVADGRLLAERGVPEMPDFTITAPEARPVAIAIFGNIGFEKLEPAGLAFAGDRSLADQFADLFQLPQKIA